METATYSLRDYQSEALDRVEAAAARGVRRQLGVAATGLGKTCIFVALARRLGVRTLIVAHRDELIEQAAARVREWWPDADIGIVKGDRDEVANRVVVASVQTLSRPNRLARLLAPTLIDEAPSFGLVVIDEAHHAAAKSYRSVMHGLRCDEPDGPLLLGVTATPDRGDGKGLDDLFDEITWSYDIRWGIARGFLSDLRGLRVQMQADLGDLKVRGGDYDVGQAGQMLEEADAPNLIARAWLEHARGRRTLVFTPTVSTAAQVEAAFAAVGVRAGHVHGAMPLDERRAVLASYARGDLDVLANCMVLTEGYDEPRTDCIIVARPTKSRALYTQMVGRGTRVHPEKQDCLVVDVVGVTDQHDLVTIPSLFGIEQANRVWADGEAMTVTEALREQVERHEREGRLLAAEARLFDKVRSSGKMAWVSAHSPGELRRYELSIGATETADDGSRIFERFVLVEREPDVWRAGHQRGRDKRILVDAVTLEMAQGVAEDMVRRSGGSGLADLNARWRQARPSKAQRDRLSKWGIHIPPGCTKGEASDLIGQYIARKRSARAG